MKVLVIFSILFLISIVTLSTSNVESLPVDGIIIKDSAGNQITPVLNKEIFFHYNVQNYGNQLQTYDLDISVNNDDINLPIFHKKMELILEPNESKPIVWNFTPANYGNYSAKITKNEITLVNSFTIENYPKSEKSGMNFSEFQEFCKEAEDRNRDLMPIEQRLLVNLCDRGLSEKHWNWISSDLDWKNFVQNVANEYAQEIPLFIEKGFEDSLIVNTSISGRDSFPPPMFAYISFYYDEDNKSKRFGEKYIVNISGEFTKAKDHRLSPLKLFNIGYHLDEIQCKENLVLVQKYDGSPACVMESTKTKLVERGWTKPVSEWSSYVPIESEVGKIGSYGIQEENKTFELRYHIHGGDITKITSDTNGAVLKIMLNPFRDGFLKITVPRDLLDSRIGGDEDDFFVLLDRIQTTFTEESDDHERELLIPFSNDTKMVEIIGSNPDF